LIDPGTYFQKMEVMLDDIGRTVLPRQVQPM
jgi:hypothetical protein